MPSLNHGQASYETLVHKLGRTIMTIGSRVCPGRPIPAAMIQQFKTWLQQSRCDHQFKYSRSKPGTLVCKKCRVRRGKP